MRKLVLAVALLAAIPAFAQTHKAAAPAAAPNPKSQHHGSWWLAKTPSYREAYVNGYKSGWHHAIGGDTPLHVFSAALIADGVDKFYSDFRNRAITVDTAISYVAQQLNGEPAEKLNTELLKLRAEAVQGSDED